MAQKTDKNEKTEKKEKVQKKIPAKKLPGILLKTYTKSQFESKILSKIYIEEDKKLILSVFEEDEKKGTFAVSKEAEFDKDQFKKIEKIGKDIKANGARFKLIPFLAVACFVAALCITVTIFKNPVTKWLIESGCESVFGAKTEVSSVNVELTGISIKVNGLSVGDKNSEEGMKNLFVAEQIVLDVSLADALRGKFICNEISVTGMDFGTDRKTSCLLPAKAEEVKEAAEESEFMKSVKGRSASAVNDVKAQLETLLGGSNPDEIWKNLQSQMKTQAAADNLKTNVTELGGKWKGKVAEIKQQVNDLQASVKTAKVTDVPALTKKANDLKKQIDEFNSDKKLVENSKKELELAIASDMKLAENITETAKNAGSIMNDIMNTVGYDMLGEYYPYAKMGIDYAVQWKKNSQTTPKEEKPVKVAKSSEAKGSTNRLTGTTFWFGSNKPSLLIKKVVATGPNFSGNALNISSNQNLTDKPMTAELNLTKWGNTHKGSIVVDARSNTKDSLITASYTGAGFNGKYKSPSDGIPSISGKTSVSFTGKFDSITDMSGKGSVSVARDGDNPVLSVEKGFGNETFDKAYKSALASVNKLDVNYGISCSEEKGVNLNLSGNYNSILKDALSGAVKGVGGDVKAQLTSKLKEQTGLQSSDALAKFGEFSKIAGDISSSGNSIETMLKELAKKQSGEAASKAADALKKNLGGKISLPKK